jgi:hypothetical protein
VVEGFLDGTLDTLATDHAPHHYDEKEQAFDDAPFGIVGLETAVGLMLTHFVHGTRAARHPGTLDLSTFVERASVAPARAFHLPGGTLREGSPADVTLHRPGRCAWTVDPATFLSKSRNTPFTGMDAAGTTVRTIVGGRSVFVLGEDLRSGLRRSGRPEAGSGDLRAPGTRHPKPGHAKTRSPPPHRGRAGSLARPGMGAASVRRRRASVHVALQLRLGRATLFGWYSRRRAARSSRITACRRGEPRRSRGPRRSRTCLMAVRIRERTARFLVCASRLSSIRFLALLMFGIRRRSGTVQGSG